jgi:hypothetical protein
MADPTQADIRAVEGTTLGVVLRQITTGAEGREAMATMVQELAHVYTGAGDPEGAYTAPQGSLFLRTDGSTNTTLYVKTAGADATGWTAK